MKKITLCSMALLLCALVLTAGLPCAQAAGTSAESGLVFPDFIYWDTEPIGLVNDEGLGVMGVSYENSTYIPLATAAQWLGCTAVWDEAQAKIVLTSGAERKVPTVDDVPDEYAAPILALFPRFSVGDYGVDVQPRPDVAVWLDGVEQHFVDVTGRAVPPLVALGSLYLPIRGVGALCGKQVTWVLENAEYQVSTIHITDPVTVSQRAELQDHHDKATALCAAATGQITALCSNLDISAASCKDQLLALHATIAKIDALPQPSTTYGDWHRGAVLLHTGDIMSEITSTIRDYLEKGWTPAKLALDATANKVRILSERVQYIQRDIDALPPQ